MLNSKTTRRGFGLAGPHGVAAALSMVVWASSARAQAPVDTPRAHFERGYALAQEGAFEPAIVEFELAYAASPHFSVLFNLGQAYGASGRAVQAEHTLVRYLELGRDQIDAEQRRRTLALIEHYRRRIGRIALTGLPQGAAVSLDGEAQGETPFRGPFEASAGRHEVSVQALGHQPVVLAVDVKAGEVSELPVVLVPLPKPRADDSAVAACRVSRSALEEAQHRRAKTQKLVALGLGAGAILTGGAAITLAIVNGSRYSEWRADANAFMSTVRSDPSGANLSELDALLAEENAIRNRDSIAIGLGVAAGTFAVAALGLYLTAGRSTPTLSVSPQGGSVGFRGAF